MRQRLRHGNYSGQLTIAAENDIIVDGNLTELRGGGHAGPDRQQLRPRLPPLLGSGNQRSSGVARATSTIDAAILAINHSFIVDNYNCGAQLGTLNVNGAIAQKFRGPVGTYGSGGTGYLKNYIYDDRLRYIEPPQLHRAGPVRLGDRPGDASDEPPSFSILGRRKAKVLWPIRPMQDADGPSLTAPDDPADEERRTNALVGLEIEAGSIAAAEVRTQRRRAAAATAIAPLPAEAFHDGEVADPDALAEALRALFAEHKLSKRVRLGIANQRVVVRTLRLPAIDDPKELDAAVRFQAQEQIPMPIDQAVLDHRVVGGVAGRRGRRARRSTWSSSPPAAT